MEAFPYKQCSTPDKKIAMGVREFILKELKKSKLFWFWVSEIPISRCAGVDRWLCVGGVAISG